MKTALLMMSIALALLVPASTRAQININTFPYSYTQAFTGFNGMVAGLPAGWSLTGTYVERGQGTGSSNSGGLWAFGTSPEYALGALCSGSSSSLNFKVSFKNNTASTINSLTISYDFEQWRYGGGNTNGFAASQTGIGASVSALSTSSGASTTGVATVTPKSVVLSGLSIAPNAIFSITWSIADGSGNDNGVAIDNFVLTATSSTVITPPVVTADPVNDTACTGTPAAFSITATNAGGYQWQEFNSSWSNLSNGGVYSGVTTANLSISNTTGLNGRKYRAIATGTPNDTSAAGFLIVNSLPAANINPATNFFFCKGDSLRLNANVGTGLIYQWYKNGVLQSTTGNIYKDTVSTSYYVKVTDANGCSQTSATVTATAMSHTATVTPLSSTTFCTGDSVIIQANTGSGFVYQWLKNGTVIPATITDTLLAHGGGLYSVIVTNNIGCKDTSATIQVTANAGPPATITPQGATTFCQGDSVKLDAGLVPGLSYQWLLNGTLLPGAGTSQYIAKASGDYTVKVATGVNCFTYSNPLSVIVKALPPTQIINTSPLTFCQGDSVMLITSTGLSYQWQKDGTALTTATNDTLVVRSSGYYRVINTGSNGCSDTSLARQITVHPLPAALITPSNNISSCVGDSLMLQANTGTLLNYQWNKNGTIIAGANAGNYRAGATGNYTVYITDSNGCSALSPATALTVNPLPSTTTTLSGSTKFCDGNNVVINAPSSANLTYQWLMNGSLISSTNASYTAIASGTYRVIVTNTTTTCKDTSFATIVTVYPLPAATLTATTPIVFCDGDSALLKINAGAQLSYQWTYNTLPLAGTTGLDYTAKTSGAYAVAVTDSNSCTKISNILNVVVNPMPNNHITYSTPLAFCEGGAVVLIASGAGTGTTYQWLKDGLAQGVTTYSNIVDQTGIYSVIQTNIYNCTNTSPGLPVTVWPSPNATITRNGMQLSTDSFVSYQWFLNNQPLANETGRTINATRNGGYNVEVVDANGCHKKTSIVFVNNVGVSSVNTSAGIRVYPNPVEDVLHIEAPFTINAVMSDIQGHVLIVQDDVHTINTSNLPAGIYLLRLVDRSGATIRTEKVYKTK